MSCHNPCTGLKQLNYWCSDDPCNLGIERPFMCECETNPQLVIAIAVGVSIGVVVLIAVPLTIILCMYQRRRRRRLEAMGNTSIAPTQPVYTHPPQSYPVTTVIVQPYPQACPPPGQSAFVYGGQPPYGYNPNQQAPAPQPVYGVPMAQK